MSGEKEIKVPCLLCQKQFHFGHGRRYGRFHKRYKAYVCDGCFSGNEEGIADEEVIERLFAHLDAHGIERPERNENGCIPL